MAVSPSMTGMRRSMRMRWGCHSRATAKASWPLTASRRRNSVLNVAREKFWFAPVSLILRHRFDSLSLAPKIDKPALFMVAGEDTIVPQPHARRLYEAWGGPKQWHLVARENHDSIDADDGYWRAIGAFLNR